MIQTIQKSRKEYHCDKCGRVIPKGSKYIRGEMNFSKPKIRCIHCGLEHWEMTTSDYLLSIGQLLNRWEEDFGVSEDTPQEISDHLEELMDELQERLDNMPESLQDSDTGTLLQDRIDGLEAAMSDLDLIDIDDIKAQAAAEAWNYDHDDVCEEYEPEMYDELFNDKARWEVSDGAQETAAEYFTDEIRDQIQQALDNNICTD